jgi:hypothetical protein
MAQLGSHLAQLQQKQIEQNEAGAVEPGFYRVEGDVVHLVTVNGTPRKGRTSGKPLTRTLSAGETAREAAYRLTKENLPARKSDFNRKIYYPSRGKI